jgi:DNA-binding response OmpR family regulator
LLVRVLVAETDLLLLAEMRRALEHAGHDVIVADNGMVAWSNLACGAPPDLMVTRIHFGPGVPPGTALGMRA